jgi:[protein-PII] uridylyltransferase
MPATNLRPAVLAARERLHHERGHVRSLHAAGESGLQVNHRLTELIDGVVSDLYQAALEDLGDAQLRSALALVPHGGYGRRHVAPFSDVDLMLLYAEDAERRVQPLAARLMQDICDSGLTLGQSLRTPADACRMAFEDVTVFTSLVEARYLAGSERLFARFQERFSGETRRRQRALVGMIEAARQEERNRYGETVFLLTPHIKRSYGGLRDVQLVRWIGFARYGQRELSALHALAALEEEDRRQLTAAHEFLLRIRNEMHFHAGKSHDLLDRLQQVRLAEWYGCTGDEGLIPVEQFMRQYFLHTSNVRYAASHFLASAKTRVGLRTFLNAMSSHDVEGDFRVGPQTIGATRRGMEKVARDLSQVLRLMDLANLYDKRIDHRTWSTIRQAMMQTAHFELTPEVRQRFLSLISQPGRLAALLRRLHELRVLEKIIPGFRHARALVQFNEYHKYTVDEHCLRAVEAATEFLDHPGALGEAYRRIKNKTMLHLALLIHDLGKGHPEDHSEVGLRLARETAELLQLSEEDSELLQRLVHKHLLLSHLAQFRDVNDPAVIVDLAFQVGTPEALRMLYVLTCADVAAVGPGALTLWKREVFTQLYRNAMRQLTGEPLAESSDEQQQRCRAALRRKVGSRGDAAWWDRQIEALPPSLLVNGPASQIVEDLDRLQNLSRSDVIASARYVPAYRAIEYTVGTFEDIAPGIFHRLTGVLSSQRMDILSAQIHTLADGLVWDRFLVHDRDHEGPPDAERLEEVKRRLVQALKHPTSSPPKFSRFWNEDHAQRSTELHRPPVQVRIDQNTSERFTIIDVFALDRTGLLYTITRMLFEFGLSVHMAKIGTHLDQVVDVFYVTDQSGLKMTDEHRLQEIREQLLQRIVEFEMYGIASVKGRA